jgi:hypothetical protein
MSVLQKNVRGVVRGLVRVLRRIRRSPENKDVQKNRYIPLARRYQVVIPRGVSATNTPPQNLKRLATNFKSLGKDDLVVATVTHKINTNDKKFPGHFVVFVEGEKREIFILPRELVSFPEKTIFV